MVLCQLLKLLNFKKIAIGINLKIYPRSNFFKGKNCYTIIHFKKIDKNNYDIIYLINNI